MIVASSGIQEACSLVFGTRQLNEPSSQLTILRQSAKNANTTIRDWSTVFLIIKGEIQAISTKVEKQIIFSLSRLNNYWWFLTNISPFSRRINNLKVMYNFINTLVLCAWTDLESKDFSIVPVFCFSVHDSKW